MASLAYAFVAILGGLLTTLTLPYFSSPAVLLAGPLVGSLFALLLALVINNKRPVEKGLMHLKPRTPLLVLAKLGCELREQYEYLLKEGLPDGIRQRVDALAAREKAIITT